MRQAILIGLFLLGLVVAGSAQAATVSNSDLLQDATWNEDLSNLSGTYYNDENVVTEALLRDGSAATGSVMASIAKPEPWGTAPISSIWVYNLNTSVNTGGYNLSEVNLFFGAEDRETMAVKVEYSKDGGATFHVLIDMGYSQVGSPISIDVAATGKDATGVDAVRFSWASDWTGSPLGSPNPGLSSINNSGTPVYEIDVFGKAGTRTRTVAGAPVPAPAGLALLGLGSMGLAFIRRRKAQKA
jgi:hypothetical protein